MSFIEILTRNGIDTRSHAFSCLSLPEKVFFLEPDYLKKCCAMAQIPADLADEVLAFADEIKKDPVLKKLAWHLFRLFCVLPEFKAFPDHIDLTGPRTGILYLIIYFSFYQPLKDHIALNNLPLELADDAMPRLTPLLPFRGIIYPGERGLQGKALPFVLHYKNNLCFRIKRFDFILSGVPSWYPELFRERKSGKFKLLCRRNWNVDEAGNVLPPTEEPIDPPIFTETENSCTGRVIDPVSGAVTSETVTLDLAEYERLLPPGSHILALHIPGGGGMTMEVCKESFIEAKKFFTRYFPNVQIAAIGCVSWILNPVWREYLPDSNMSKLQYRTLAFPFQPVPRSGLYFVFGREDGEPSEYPEDNSMRRAMLKAWRENKLGSAGMLLPFDCIEAFPLDQGK